MSYSVQQAALLPQSPAGRFLRKLYNVLFTGLLAGLALLFAPSALFGQCNPSGNVSRYEFNINPTSMLNIIGQQFCTSQAQGTNCCGAQPSYRCLDMVINLSNGPDGELFGENCEGVINLMTANGNFDALYFSIGTPDPMGNATDCNTPIMIGNNHMINVMLSGNNMGQIEVTLSVIDNMGMTIFNNTQTANPGESVILTICKPGFGCLEDEFIFGCCEADATLALAPMAPSTICAGASSTLKVTGLNGTPPYDIAVRAASAIDTTYFTVTVNDDMDGNTTMDMTTVPVSPNATTTYTALSVEDATGCVQPIMGQSVTITVNPVPSVDPTADQTVCNGAQTAEVIFTGPVPGTVFNWTNNTPSIGLAASGSGDIAAFAAVNNGASPVTATVVVTPVFSNNGVDCSGVPDTFLITVNPTPTVTPANDQTVCNGAQTATVNFSGAVPGTVFNWTNNTPSIGLAANGSGDIAAFSAVNNGIAPVTATIIVTPSYTNNNVPCSGTQDTFLITVNPTPTVNLVANQTVCNGDQTAAVNFSGAVPGTVFNWTNNTPSIGLAANGSGNIPAFAAVNNGVGPVTATITVTPVYTNNGVSCSGVANLFTITVNPTPNVVAVSNQSVCGGDLTTAITFSGGVAGTIYNWTNSNPSIGLAAAGSGNIPAFVAQNAGNNVQIATITVTPTATNNGVPCSGSAQVFTITVFPRPTVFAGNDQTICQNQIANVVASLGGGATGGTWSGGAGTFGNPFSPSTTYTPAPAEYGTTFELVFVTNDPTGPCPAASDTLLLTVNTLPLVNAGDDTMICLNENLDLSKLGASIQPNGSGVSTGNWSTSGTGVFQPNTSFATATTYVPSMADRQAGFVTLTLTSADPAGPCTAVSDQVVLSFQPNGGLVCNDNVMVALDKTGMAEILPDMILEGTYMGDMFTVDVLVNGLSIGNKVDCTHLGKTLMVRVTDDCSGVFCMGSISVKDNLPPMVMCTDIEVICAVTNSDPAYLQNVLGLANVYPVLIENCPPAQLTYKDYWNDLTCDDDYIGYIRRVWTAVDASGNKASCTQYINFIHQGIDDVIFPPDVTLDCSSGTVNTAPQVTGTPYLLAYGQIFPLYPDQGFCKLAIAYVDNTLKTCDGTYDILRTWTVYDMCEPTTPMPPFTNPKYYIQNIKVQDNTGPVLVCPDDLTVSTDPLQCCATVNLPDITVEDVCSRIKSAFARVDVRHDITGDIIATYDVPGTLTTFPGNLPFDPDTLVVFGFTPCLPLGTHTVTYTVEDDCSNTSTCSFELTVEDQTPPVPACDEITQVSLGIDGMIFVNAATFDDGSYDNCSDSVWFKVRRLEANTCQSDTLFHDQVKFCCEDIGDTVLVVLRVYDVVLPGGSVPLDFEEENSNECMVQVYIDDKIKPTCQPPANVTVSCENFDPSLWAYGMATGTDNCCIDTIIVNENYQLFDTVCNKGTIVRTFRVFDCGGLSSQCTQRIAVEYEQDYYVRFPNDWILTVCDGSGNFGEPQFFGEDCELIGVSSEDEIFTVVPDACLKIERTWTIINWCTFNPNEPCIFVPNPNPNPISHHPSNLVGPTVSAPGTLAPWTATVTKINPGDPTNTDYSSFWSKNANCYKYKQIIKIIDTQKPEIECPDSTVQVCDLTSNDALLWNQPYWYDQATGGHDLCEAPSDLCITATDACSGANINVRYLLFLDLDNNGTMETVISSTNLPDPNTVLFDNAQTLNYQGGTPRAFDNRPVPLNQKYRFAIQTEKSGNKVTACVRWNTLQQPGAYTIPELPYGTHKIKWFVEDGCGNEQVCEYTFVVKDCKAPTIVCLNGISTNIMPTGMIMVDQQLLIEDSYDNCTPDSLLIFGIRKANTGAGFPFNPDGTPQTNVTFTCAELSFQLVEIWAMDIAGNSDFCVTYIHVQDNAGACGANNATVAGALLTEDGDGVEDASVQVTGLSPNGQAPLQLVSATDNQGLYVFPNAIPLASNAVVTPWKDNDPLNGVSTFDLVLINKHILGLIPLSSPYKMIAADANNSRSITTQDIVELRKLILGINTDFPDNTSWRFVDKSYVFPNVYNPFQDIFPESKSLADIQSSQMAEDFVAVKTGDVNGNAVTNSLLFVDERTDGTLLFPVDDRLLEAGETFTVQLSPAEPVLGYQFTLYFPEMELVDIQAGEGMSLANFGTFPDEKALTVSFDAASSKASAGGFSITCRALKAGKLSQFLKLSGRITKAEAYRAGAFDSNDLDALHERLDVRLRFDQEGTSTLSGVGFELYQNQPNPWTNTTRISFHLPETEEATLSIFDETGKVLYTTKKVFARGYNALAIDNSVLDASGLLYYKLETDNDQAVRKMVRIR